MTKEYIEEQYKLAASDFKVAHSEDEQWEARKAMARLDQLAAESYGFTYSESLRKLVDL